MLNKIKLFIETLTKYFWPAIILTGIMLCILAVCKPEIFNFKLLLSKAGIEQAILVFVVIMALSYLLISLIIGIKMFISNKLFGMNEKKLILAEKNRLFMKFFDDLFVNPGPNPISNEPHNKRLLKIFVLTIYKNKITKFQCDEIFNIFENEAMEKQLHAKEGEYIEPVLSERKCIEIQKLLTAIEVLSFDGTYYYTNSKLFEKIKEIEQTGMLIPVI